MKKWILPFVLTTSFSAFADTQCVNNTTFNVGAGIYDITGPAAEQGMMGYGMLGQRTSGIAQRLWARAFVIESPCNNKRVVFVNTDLGMVFQAVKQQVMKKLKSKYGNRFDDSNVLLTATHTHSGPGGFSTYSFYNITTLGFNRFNFETIVDGIVHAIERAQKNLAPAQIKIAKGDLKGISYNRSPESYLLNPEEERLKYRDNTDTEMTLIRFDRLDGTPIGIINWFPLHGVSMNSKNYLISSDNKGYAEYFFEKDFNSDYGPTAFVAAFAQSNAGDVSPNEYGHEGGKGLDGLAATEKAGKPQYEKAKELYAAATEVVKGGVDYRHEFVSMGKVPILPAFTDGKAQTTCPAAIGFSMLAGTQDGEGIGKQGMTCDELSKVIPQFVCQIATTECQGVKPIIAETGTKKPYPWTPDILPLQEFKIGNLVIVATPFELTTMTGRRLSETVAKQLPAVENNRVVISALSNAYSGYVTTNEEYKLQRYEGASNHFGEWTSAALKQEFTKLTKALIADKSVAPGVEPEDLLGTQIDLQPGVLFDTPPLAKNFGDIAEEPNPYYHRGDTVIAKFWGGHPKNNFRIQGSFLEVQHLENGKWKTVRLDRDWDTEYQWSRSGISCSLITITWRMPKDVPTGTYRIVHHGDSKSIWSGDVTPYDGYSSEFKVSE